MTRKICQSALLVVVLIFTAAVIPGILQKAQAAKGDVEWAKSAGEADGDYGEGIAVDSAGNSYVIGSFYETATFGSITLASAGYRDIFVAKYDNNGNVVWAKRAGGADWDYGEGIAVDSLGNSYITGIFSETATFGSITLTSVGNGDMFVAKYNSNGNVIWVKSAGGTTNVSGKGIAVDSSGHSYVTGYFWNTAMFGSNTLTSVGYNDTFIAKYDNSGNVVWAKSTGGATSGDYGEGIAVDSAGNSYVTGYFGLSGDTVSFSSKTITTNGDWDMFVSKYDSKGNEIWAKSTGGTRDANGWAIAVDSLGNSYVTGGFSGTATFGSTTLTSAGSTDIFVAKYNSRGNVIWVKSAEGSSSNTGYGIAVDTVGNIYVTGNFQGTATFGLVTLVSLGNRDIFTAKYDSSGNVIWAKSAGGADSDYGRGINVDSARNSYITGYFNGTGTFGSTTLTAIGGDDIFVAKFEGSDFCPESLCNGDFEAGVDMKYWIPGHGTNQIVTDIVQDGSKAYYTEHTYGTGENPRWSGVKQDVTVESAQVYALTGYYQNENAARGHIKITWKDVADAVIQVDYPVANISGTNSSWIEFSKLITAPAGAETAEIKIWHGLDATNQNVLGSKIWFDSLTFDVATTSCGTLCNESFEHGLLYWTQSGKVGSNTIEQTGAHEGTKVMRSEQLYTAGEEVKWTGVNQYAQVKEGTIYRLRGWFKTENASNGHVRIRWRNDAGTVLLQQYPIGGINGTNSTWFKREAIITAPTGATKAEVTIWHGVTGSTTNVPGSTVWVDDITMICATLCNGGFEDGNVHWEVNGTNEGELVTTDVQEGAQAMKIVQNQLSTDQAQWAGISQRALVTGGESYDLSFWLKKENVVQGHVKVKWRDANDQVISTQYLIGGINGTDLTWTQQTAVLTAPANAETIELFIWHGVDGTNQNATGSTLYIDNLTLTQAP